MGLKISMLFAFLLVLAAIFQVDADFYYNRYTPPAEELADFNYTCAPGRTYINVTAPPPEPIVEESESEYERRALRTHMTFKTDDELCQMCVCSSEGKDYYCSKRPAKNVNECLRMYNIMQEFKSNIPFDHERSLSFRMRRDYLWHNDEIPYEARAKCQRGHSYYTNNINAQDTDIDVDSEIDSLLDYSVKIICYYCVCSVHGRFVGCVARRQWYCDFYRNLKTPDAARDRYTGIFQQDRPAYFRQLSYRLRRTMDGGMFDLVETGGDALCCDHPSGHRRHLHNHIRAKIRNLKRKVNKENMMEHNNVGSGKENENCIPFVSEYTDCTEDNMCDGCVKCTCNSNSAWECKDIKQCSKLQAEDTIEEVDIDNALDAMMREMKQREDEERRQSKTPLVPRPGLDDDDEDPTQRGAKELLLARREYSVEDEILQLMRQKRAASIGVHNETVKFYHTKDEVNEDTLKHLNVSGTLKAKKFDGKLQSRRAGLSNNNSTHSLQIEFSQPKIYNDHITDNKIDTMTTHEEKTDPVVRQKLAGLIGNHTQEEKNHNLTRLLVSELSHGHEVIGDRDAPVISNITFLEQNETLTAMALIAGNLLNKLWHMEKDATGDAIDIEMLRHEKIADLLELFKEPLNLKQQQFLKNALEQLSSALDKNKKIEDISLCANVEELKKAEAEKTGKDCDKNKKTVKKVDPKTKINDIVGLVKKYEHLQNKLNVLRSGVPKDTVDKIVTKDEQVFLNNYGQILESITKLLVPKSSGKKIMNGLKNSNPLVNDASLRQKLKDLYDIDLGNMNLTAKDKIVLDYLTHIQSKPDCLLKKQKPFVTPTIEGNILLNLSEFFKIKSLSELFNKIGTGDQKRTNANARSGDSIVQDYVDIPALVQKKTTTTTTTRKPALPSIIHHDIKERSKIQNRGKFEATKVKLKEHLKAILEDIVELQKSAGQTTDGKSVKIADALPCIYQLLNSKPDENVNLGGNSVSSNDLSVVNPTKKMKEIFETLKNDLKFTQTRRTGSYSGPRPKSAIVWERVVRNQGENKMKTRRSFDALPMSLEQIRKLILHRENTESNAYKNYALMYEVPTGDRYVLLKAFESDVNTYINLLESIKKTIDPMTTIPSADYTEIKNFIDNAVMSINLNERIVKNLDKPKSKEPSIKEFIAKNNLTKQRNPPARFTKISNAEQISNKRLDTVGYRNYDSYESNDPYKAVNTLSGKTHNNNVKLTREQLIIQLIRNRIQHYIKVKETEMNINGDINYDIAKKILQNLDLGNYELAKELYKIFAMYKSKGSVDGDESSTRYVDKPSFYETQSNFNKQPLIQFEDIKEKEISNKDQLIKQLLSLRNLKM